MKRQLEHGELHEAVLPGLEKRAHQWWWGGRTA